jgi:hypothetical protein
VTKGKQKKGQKSNKKKIGKETTKEKVMPLT